MKPVQLVVAALLSLLLLSSTHAREVETVFVGIPLISVTENGIDRKVQRLPADEAERAKCVIMKSGSDLHWTSRDNARLTRHISGAFDTFVVEGGTGTVRVIRAGGKDLLASLGETERRYDYVEHVFVGLTSITYYGVRRPVNP